MARSAQSASFASVPGFRQAPVYQAAYPEMPAPPSIPTVPGIDDARAPGAVERSLLQSQLTNLPGKYAGQLTAARSNAQAGLAGYGGWSWGQDNPATPQREDLLVNFDPNDGPGERGKQAVRDVRSQFAKQGALYSSQANQAIGGALQKLSLEAQGVVQQYASQISGLLSEQAAESSNLVNQWTRLYGEDSRWLAENPPPPPPAPVAPPPPVAAPAPAPVDAAQQQPKMLGPWDAKPNLDPDKFRIGRPGSGPYKGKWVAFRREGA